jgi:hypothetical protein
MENQQNSGGDLSSLLLRARFYALLATIHERSGNAAEALRVMEEAKEIRARALKRTQVNSTIRKLTCSEKCPPSK